MPVTLAFYNNPSTTFVAWNWDAGSSNTSVSAGSITAASTVSSGNAYSAGWAGLNTGAWGNSDSWSGLSAVSNNAKGYFSSTENLSNGSVISVANSSFSAGSSGSNGWVLRANSSVTLNLTVYPNITEIATTNSDSQTFADRTIVATNPSSGSSLVVTGKCIWFSTTSQMSVSTMGTVNDVAALPTIASTVRANPSAGFSIVSHTGNGTSGATIGHGLNATPAFVIIKNRDDSDGWGVMHTGSGLSGDNVVNTTVPEYKMLYLNETNSAANWTGDVVAPNGSSVVTLGSGPMVNNSGEKYISYCFAPVEGYSAFGSYTGNNSADGPFVYTGFKPRWVMIKATSFSEHWYIYDTKRKTYNVNQQPLLANEANGGLSYEGIADGGQAIDILSNGFKIRGAWLTNNASQNYIWIAFAEHPFKTARAR